MYIKHSKLCKYMLLVILHLFWLNPNILCRHLNLKIVFKAKKNIPRLAKHKAGSLMQVARISPVFARRGLATASCQVGHVSTNLHLKKLIFSPGENLVARRICICWTDINSFWKQKKRRNHIFSRPKTAEKS
jgi:hypothetical protein